MLTLEQAKEIVEKNDTFLTKIDDIYSHKVQQFSYRLASYSDFADPIPGSGLQAFNMRGVSYLENGTRFLMLNKFFNLNETTNWMLDDVKHKKIVRIQDKLDGSMIRFIRLPDGSVHAKTKYSFQAEQAKMAQEYYETHPEFKNFVLATLDHEEAAIFELVSPYNKIVLDYPETELRLLQVRNELTGKYEDFYNWPNFTILYPTVKFTQSEPLLTWDELLELKKTVKNKEGWVVTLEDGQILKVKTDWYLSLHRLLTENIYQTQYVIASILDENIDDVLSALPENFTEVRSNIQKVSNIIVHHWNHLIDDVKNTASKYDGDRKSFAIAHKDMPLFGLYMLTISKNGNDEFIQNICKEYIKKNTTTMSKAEEYLSSIGGISLAKKQTLEQ